jgi:hypothetical protein
MATREVCLLISHDNQVLWSDESDNAFLLPDSRERWEAIWRCRAELAEVAHSHPEGPLGFSAEDESTMSALTSALGRPLRFSVVAPEGMVSRVAGRDVLVSEEPWWAEPLRRVSGMRHEPIALA